MRTRANSAIRNYIGKVECRLSKLPKEERQAILDELNSHISEALVTRTGDVEPTSADVQAILAEMDAPEAFGKVEPSAAPRYIVGKIALCLSILGALFTVMLIDFRTGSDSFLRTGTIHFHGVSAISVGVVAQAVALTIGILAWRSIFGKLATVLSLIWLLLMVYANVIGLAMLHQ
jgi:hypothetical protein